MKNWWGKGRFALLLAAGILMLLSVRLPVWSIYLWSFSYPDGIGMTVYTYKPADPPDIAELDGGMHEFQVLNHFIGMRPITSDLIVFKLLPAGIVVSGGLLVIAAFWKRRNFLYGAVGATCLVGLYGAVSFLYYMYMYGHDLDPNAAIDVEPFMPGLWGENQLAQFTTWSQFESGALFLVLGTVLALTVVGVEYGMSRKQRRTN